MNKRVRMKMLLAGTAGAFLFCGCSPRVLTEVRADYPAQSAERVMVYGTDEAVPEDADTVGSIRVLDSGLTTKCRYAQVLQMAAERTAACGGNALHIDVHSQPNFWTSCHRINGTILEYNNHHDGTIFSNREGYLPQGVQYTEYVVPTPGKQGPGLQRIIVGSDGSWYYTPDHYNYFFKFKP